MKTDKQPFCYSEAYVGLSKKCGNSLGVSLEDHSRHLDTLGSKMLLLHIFLCGFGNITGRQKSQFVAHWSNGVVEKRYPTPCFLLRTSLYSPSCIGFQEIAAPCHLCTNSGTSRSTKKRFCYREYIGLMELPKNIF